MDGAIRSRLVRAVATQAEVDLCEDFSELAPYLQIAPSVVEMSLCAFDKILEDISLFQKIARVAIPAPERS